MTLGRHSEKVHAMLAQYWGLSTRAYNALRRANLFRKDNAPRMKDIDRLVVSCKKRGKYETFIPLIGEQTAEEIRLWYVNIKPKRVFMKKLNNMPKVKML